MTTHSPLDAPPGMTWRETPSDRGTHIYFSGTPAPRLLVGLAWGLIALGVVYEVLFNVPGGTTQGSVLAMQATPIIMIVLGASFAWRWRQSGGSAGVLDVGRAALSVQRGLIAGPLELEPRQVRELLVSDQAQDYQVESRGYAVSETARWFQVTLVTSAGKRHALACFGEHACAEFYVLRVAELLRDAAA